MPEVVTGVPDAPYHFPIFGVIIWRLYYILTGPSFAIATISLLWLVFRLHRVVRQPVDRLIEILGIEVPSPPLIELLDISSDSVSVHWWATEKYSSTKYSVRVNGVNIGEVSAQETAISITGLAAGVYYTVRIVASTQGKYHAASDAIRIQTASDISQDEDTASNPPAHGGPSVVPYKGAYEGLATPLSAPPLVREHSGGLPQPRRRGSLRKSSPSPFTPPADKRAATSTGVDHSQKTIQALTARLNELRKETDEQERQDDEEDRQFHSESQSLSERRDQLKLELKEKEDSSKELRKVVAQLERQNQTAQVKRAAQEKALETKQNEHRKLRDDRDRWDQETDQLQLQIESMRVEKEKVEEDAGEQLSQLRNDREPIAEAVRKLEEQIRDIGKHVKELEEFRKESSEASESPKLPESEPKLETEFREHDDRMRQLSEELKRKYMEVQQVQQLVAQMRNKFESVITQRRAAQGNNTYDPNAAEFTPSSHFIGPQRETSVGERRASLGAYSQPLAPPSTNADTRSPFPMSLYPNVESGLAPNDAENDKWLRTPNAQAALEKLTGGALTSPAANALLPSGLLGDEVEDPFKRHKTRRSGHESDSVGDSRPPSTLPPPGSEYHQALRETSNPLPGLGALPGLGSSSALISQNPQSPVAAESRSPSLTSSPHDSIYHRPSDGFMDSDRRSIRSTSSSSRAFGSGRPSRLLGDVFSRQRGKSSTDEGPALGSLRSSESQSLPRQSEQGEASETTLASTQRRATSGLFSSMLSRRGLGSGRLANSNDDINQPAGPGSGQLGSRMFPWSHSSLDAAGLSRPTSVYSAENVFPRPSGEVHQPFGWNDSGLGRSNTTVSNRHRMNPWSSGSSRRESAAIDPSVLSDIDQADEDALPQTDRNESPMQAPIGTKPAKGRKELKESALQKQLNPNARDFRSMFSRDKRGDKKRDKSASRPETADTNPDDLGILGAPHVKDSKVHSDTGSTEDVSSTRSPRASESGPPTPSESTPNTRESLMKKLTRKSSQLPGLKGRKTGGSNTPQTNNEDTDEDAATGFGNPIVRTPSSMTSSPKVSQDKEKDKEKDTISKRSSGFSLNSFKRRGKKEKDAPSISETSMTSGTDDAEKSERPSTDD